MVAGKRDTSGAVLFQSEHSPAGRIQYHERGFDTFATTLASSRWKSLEQIAEAGHAAAAEFADVEFWEKNWRKGGLSERRRILLAENGFYNQQYCGCEFSMRPQTGHAPESTNRTPGQE